MTTPANDHPQADLIDEPHARKIVDDTDAACEAERRGEGRQEALVDEGIEETFPASDPVSVKRIT